MKSLALVCVLLLGLAVACEGQNASSISSFERLRGHTGPISCVAFSPDGRILATASLDNTIRLWDTSTWRTKRTLRETGGVYWTTFSPDGTTLASGGISRKITLWDANSGKVKRSLRIADLFSKGKHQHTGGLAWCSRGVFSPDGQVLATEYVWFPQNVSVSETVLWNVATGKMKTTLHGEATPVFSYRGVYLVTTTDDAVRVRDASNGRILRSIKGELFPVAFMPNRTLLAGRRADGSVLAWDVTNGQSSVLMKNVAPLKSMVFSPNGEILALGSEAGTMWLINGSAKKSYRLIEHTDAVNSLTFSPDKKFLVSGSSDQSVRVWRTP